MHKVVVFGHPRLVCMLRRWTPLELLLGNDDLNNYTILDDAIQFYWRKKWKIFAKVKVGMSE